MKLRKAYHGYTSFSYLEPGVDYQPFVLADEHERVAPYLAPLTDAEEQRVARLLDEHVMISLYEHLGITAPVRFFRLYGGPVRFRLWPYNHALGADHRRIWSIASGTPCVCQSGKRIPK